MPYALLKQNSIVTLLNTPNLRLTTNVVLNHKECGISTINILEDCIMLPDVSLLIPITSSILSRLDNTILIKNGNQEYELIVANLNSLSMLWSALSIISTHFSIPAPSLSSIEFIAKYLSFYQQLISSYLSKDILNSDFIQKLYEAFVAAETSKCFMLLPLFRVIIISLFRLQSKELTQALLSAEHVDHTIACLEYDDASLDYKTTHRSFLRNTELSPQIPFYEKCHKLARTNYRINYIKNLLEYHLPLDVLSSIQVVLEHNTNLVIHSIFSEKNFAKEIVRFILPVIISVNEVVVLSASPRMEGLHFLLSLLSTRFSDTKTTRLLRKLYQAALLENLDYIYKTYHYRIVLEIFLTLYQLDPHEIHGFLTHSRSSTIPEVLKRIHTDDKILLDFIYLIAPEKVQNIIMQPVHASIEFINHVVKQNPALIHSHINQIIHMFIEQTSLLLKHPNAEQKRLCISIYQLFHNTTSSKDLFFMETLFNHSCFLKVIESIFVMTTVYKDYKKCNNIFNTLLVNIIKNLQTYWKKSFQNVYGVNVLYFNSKNLDYLFALVSKVRQRCMSRLFYKWKEMVRLEKKELEHTKTNEFLMDAIHLLAWRQKQFYKNMALFSLRTCFLPIIKRCYLREAWREWRTFVSKSVKFTPESIDSGNSIIYSQDSLSSINTDRSNKNLLHLLKTFSTESIGEKIDVFINKKDDDMFFSIRSIKEDYPEYTFQHFRK